MEEEAKKLILNFSRIINASDSFNKYLLKKLKFLLEDFVRRSDNKEEVNKE